MVLDIPYCKGMSSEGSVAWEASSTIKQEKVGLKFTIFSEKLDAKVVRMILASLKINFSISPILFLTQNL